MCQQHISTSYLLGQICLLVFITDVNQQTQIMMPDLNALQIGKTAFKGTKKLNLIQSVVFEAAYNTNENLLICAPTGAGKTNIAMLAVLRELKQHIAQGVIKTDEFKVLSCCNYCVKCKNAEFVRFFHYVYFTCYQKN